MQKILVVEDDNTVREMLVLNLRAEGYEVCSAAAGDEGLELARALSPDLIVLDVMLPVVDGITICRLLRRTHDMPIIMLTARGTESDKIIGLETGADDYIVKPFSLGEFLARVRAALRRSGHTRIESEFRAGDLRLDMVTRRVYRAAEEIILAPKEFELLGLLMQHAGAVLSRKHLLTHIWGDDFGGESRTVDVHIRWLREKLEEDPSNPVSITTVRGVGYRFEG